ncbi:hypothetical protein, partial [Peribacillus simplex]|uniref:hypothetical protein n=1 Tax=Peribacillus simplex TaxID=1478 RepID=UPI000BDC9EFB
NELLIEGTKKEIKKQEDIINLYSNLYGEFELKSVNNHTGLSEFDEDKSFFDYIKPKNNNNDFNNEQIA